MSSKRSTKKRSSRRNSTSVKSLHQLLWLSGALQASGLLSDEKLGAVAWTKRPDHSQKYNDRAKTTLIGQLAAAKKYGHPDGVGSFFYGRVKKQKSEPWKPEESEGIDLRRLPPAPRTRLPTVHELKSLEEQLRNEMKKRTRRNQRASQHRISLRNSKRSQHFTRKGKRGSISSRR
jgi:hypothetical protein